MDRNDDVDCVVEPDERFFNPRWISLVLLLSVIDVFTVPLVRKKYDDGRHTEYQRLNEIAHIYQALNAANNWSGHNNALLKKKKKSKSF